MAVPASPNVGASTPRMIVSVMTAVPPVVEWESIISSGLPDCQVILTISPQVFTCSADNSIVPSLENNTSVWGDSWDWSQRGEEWSEAWGGVSHQWWTTL